MIKRDTLNAVRRFSSGATRDSLDGKHDYAGFFDAGILERYAEYMHKNRKLADGSTRNGDDWKSGMPDDVYLGSLLRHAASVWRHISGEGSDTEDFQEALCGVLFNTNGLLRNDLTKSKDPVEKSFDDYLRLQREAGFAKKTNCE